MQDNQRLLAFAEQYIRRYTDKELTSVQRIILAEAFKDGSKRKIMAESMDMSLIDSKKAESLSTIDEINNVIRMSFIEAQFIKKVRALARSLTGVRRRNLILRCSFYSGNDERVISSR